MTISSDEKQKHIEWLEHRDIQKFLRSNDIPTPWFPAFRFVEKTELKIRWFAALVPSGAISHLVKRSSGWDIGPSDGGPGTWTYYNEEGKTQRYYPFGNEDGIEPIVIWRSFHGIRPDFLELAQEIRLIIISVQTQRVNVTFTLIRTVTNQMQLGMETILWRFGPICSKSSVL